MDVFPESAYIYKKKDDLEVIFYYNSFWSVFDYSNFSSGATKRKIMKIVKANKNLHRDLIQSKYDSQEKKDQITEILLVGHLGERFQSVPQKFTFNVLVRMYSVACSGKFRWYVLLFAFSHLSQITELLDSV